MELGHIKRDHRPYAQAAYSGELGSMLRQRIPPWPLGDAVQRLSVRFTQQQAEITILADELAAKEQNLRKIGDYLDRQIMVPFQTQQTIIEAWSKSLAILTRNRFEPVAAALARIPNTIKKWPHLSALAALEGDDRTEIDDYLRVCCGTKEIAPDMYWIIWEILRRGGWRKASSHTGYIRKVFWREVKKSAAAKGCLLGRPGVDSIEDFAEFLPVIENGYNKVDDDLMVEWALQRLDPRDREAILRHYYEGATMMAAYGDKNLQDAGRRRLRKTDGGLRAGLIM